MEGVSLEFGTGYLYFRQVVSSRFLSLCAHYPHSCHFAKIDIQHFYLRESPHCQSKALLSGLSKVVDKKEEE